MVYFGVLIGLILIIAMSYMALNKKTDSLLRKASIIALAVMMLSLIVCLIIIFTDTSVPVDESVVIVGAPVQVKGEKSSVDIIVLVLLIIIIIAAFFLIMYLAIKEQKKASS